MSKANSAIKVLRVALKRVEKRWGKRAWSKKDDAGTYRVCLEGAITGGCEMPNTQPQQEALRVVRTVILERFPEVDGRIIPVFNDAQERTIDEIIEVIKLSIIRL